MLLPSLGCGCCRRGVKMYGGDARRTITGALRAGALQPSSSPDALAEPKPLHRLDAAVGGVLLIAKTASAAADVSRQFVERRVHKVYHALLCGQLLPGAAVSSATAPAPFQQRSEAEGSVSSLADSSSSSGASSVTSAAASSDEESGLSDDADEEQQDSESAQLLPLEELLQRQLLGAPAFPVTMQDLADPVLESPADCIAAAEPAGSSSGSSAGAAGLGVEPGVHVVDLPVEGRPSFSLYQVLGYSRSARYGGWVTSVALSPVTGRKHQLRRHMAALGCPMLGDGK